MQSNSVGNISRPSSIALSTANRETTIDDRTIAQGLLSLQNIPSLKIPRRKSSILGASPGHQSFDGMDPPHQAGNIPVSSLLKPPSRRALPTSNTWTSSDGEHVAEQDEVDDRKLFVEEYNILARKHGVRKMEAGGSEGFSDEFGDLSSKRDSWFSRKILRKTSSSHSVRAKPDRSLRHKRSISDLSLRLKMKKDKLKDKDLQELVILCGSSRFYLPAEYSASTLCVPTCFRATAQYLVQHGTTTRGLFRIPGSQTNVAALYNHYCSMDEYGDVVAGTVRCPTLPDHIRCDVHDVASAFKKFISGLPGGILGSLALFDAFISIQTQLHGDPELTRTKQSKVRARLIALAISTSRSQYRRDLICAVFGLLCMLGRASETARREDDRGHPLPTSDLMGYGPLGIIFGPLLVGDLLEDYTMHLADPHGGLVLLPISPPKSRKERKKKNAKSGDEGSAFNTHVDKIKVANSITEMLITHWRDVVRHMKHMDSIKHLVSSQSFEVKAERLFSLRPSASATFAIRKPPDWDHIKLDHRRLDRSVSPTPVQRSGTPGEVQNDNYLSVRKQRTKPRPNSLRHLSGARSLSILSPTVEEAPKEELHHVVSQNLRRADELSSPSSSSYKEITRAQTTKNKAHGVVNEPSNSDSDKENEHPRSTIRPSYPVVKRKPSGKIQQHVEVIESRLSPSKDSLRPTPKKLVKSQTVKDFPTKITWAVGDAANSKPATYSIKNSPFKQHESSGVPPQLVRRKSVPPPQNSVYSATNALDQPQKDQTSSTIAIEKSWPEIRLLKATSRDDNEDDDFRAQRRLGGSEPGLQGTTRTKPSRRLSKSLYDDWKSKNQLVERSKHSKDPLARVSQEDDIASLMTLAEALYTGNSADEDVVENNPSPVSTHSLQTPSRVQSANMKGVGQLSSPSPDFARSTGTNMPVPQPTDSPSSRVSTLVAKFNQGDSASDSSYRRPSSPTRSLRKSIEEDYPHNLDASKEKLVAPYMMNALSPIKSQKSANSEKTPKSSRSPVLSLARPITDMARASTLASSPRSLLRGSVHDSAPLRLTPKSLEKKASSPEKSPIPFPALHPVQKSIIKPDTTPTKIPRRKSWKPLLDGNFSTMSGSSSTQASVMERVDKTNNKHSPRPWSQHGFPDRRNTGPKTRTSGVDGPFNHATCEMIQPGSEPPHFGQHVHFAQPQSSSHKVTDLMHPESPSIDAVPSSNPVSQVGTPGPGRSNSMLYNQVRNLQRQLAAKIEEVRQLKKQLDARQNLDIGTLSEQLREAKGEIYIWKARAENTEKQLQIFKRTSRQSYSSLKESSATSAGQSKRSTTDYSADMPANTEKSMRSLRGLLDGARSTGGWNSEESCDTVIREIRENAITGSEYSLWVEQMNARKYSASED